MAGVTDPGSVWNQIGLVVQLRLRMFLNTLHKPAARWGLAGQVMMWTLGTAIIAVVAVALALAAYASFRDKRSDVLTPLLWIVFILAQVATLLSHALQSQFDSRRLLQYPLRFSAFVILNLGYGLFDETMLVFVVWMAAVGAGILFARPDVWMAVGSLWLMLFVFTLLLNRVLTAWLSRALLRRRTRERFLLLIFGLVMLPQSLIILEQRFGLDADRIYSQMNLLLKPLPPSVVARGIHYAIQKNWWEVGATLSWMAATSLLCGFLVVLRYRALYAGETLLEERGSERMRKAGAVRPGWRIPGLSSTMTAVLQKEIATASRLGMTWLMLATTPLVILVFSAINPTPQTGAKIAGLTPDLALPATLAYMAFSVLGLGTNVFGFDRSGVKFYLLAPVDLRHVLAAKNLYLTLFMTALVLLNWATIQILVGPVSAPSVLATLCTFMLFLLVYFSVGNLLSVHFPRAIEITRNANPHGMSMLLGLLTFAGFALPVGLAFVYAHARGQLVTLALWLLCVALLAWMLYRWTLGLAAAAAFRRSQHLLEELC